MPGTLGKSANEFAVDLFQCYLRRHGDKYKNLLLCPYLIYQSLAMMLVGAKGNTAQQLIKLLKIPKQFKAKSNGAGPAARRALSAGTLRRPITSSLSSGSTISGGGTGAFTIGAAPEQSLGKSRRLTPDGADEARHREFLWLTEQLIHGNHDFVHLASFIYLDKSAKRTERFKAVLRDYYETKPKKIDFDNVDLMIKTINEDVARTTENIYSDILSRQEAQKLEKSYMLLVNAVFFRGFWLSNFTDVRKASFTKTASKPFEETSSITAGAVNKPSQPPTPSPPQQQQQSVANQQQVASNGTPQQPIQYTVNMMSKLDYLPVVSDDQLDARIVQLPFEASDLQMLLVLPNNRHSDSTYLCGKITAAKIDQIAEQFSNARRKTVHVSMPIFCIDSGKISIQSTLVTMGAGDLFDKSKANMSGVCENKPVWLHKILHRCFIICDNRGAITSSAFELARKRRADFECGLASGRKGVEEFVADHPFMYIIMDSVTRTILLIGLYTDPSETLEVVHENQLSAEEAHQIYTEGVYKT